MSCICSDKSFQKIKQAWCVIVLLFRLLKTYLDFQNFSYLDFIDFCHVYNTYVYRIFIRDYTRFAPVLYCIFRCKTNTFFYRHLPSTLFSFKFD